jgi:iron complex transport system substrate-binding protein
LRIVLAAIFSIVCGVCASSAAQTLAPIVLKDDWGREVILQSKPNRIVTLSAHLTEMAFDAGLDRQIVAVDAHSRIADKRVVRLSAYPEPSIENIAKLKPDLVLLWGAGLKAMSVSRLESLGLRVFVSEPKTLQDIVANFETLLTLSRRAPSAAGQRLDNYKQALLPRIHSKIVPVFVQVWSDPLMTIGQSSFMASAMKHCGAQVLLAPANQSSAVVNPEAVVLSDTRAIVSSNSVSARDYWRKRALNKSLSWVFISLPESALSQPSTKLLDSLTVLCERLDSLR